MNQKTDLSQHIRKFLKLYFKGRKDVMDIKVSRRRYVYHIIVTIQTNSYDGLYTTIQKKIYPSTIKDRLKSVFNISQHRVECDMQYYDTHVNSFFFGEF
jgi:hypothetical protein